MNSLQILEEKQNNKKLVPTVKRQDQTMYKLRGLQRLKVLSNAGNVTSIEVAQSSGLNIELELLMPTSP